MYYIPDDKLSSLLDTARWILSQYKVKVRTLASFYGKLSSCSIALGPVASLLSRSGHILIAQGSEVSWNHRVEVSDEVKVELNILLSELPSLNGFPIKQSSSLSPSRVFASDASSSGFAALEVTCGSLSSSSCSEACVSSLVSQRLFSPFEMAQSSTYRELVALWDLYVLKGHELIGQSVLHYSDNQSVEIILSKGSPKPLLQALALDIFRSCNRFKISLEAVWIPRTDPRMQIPDFYSRVRDLSDWGLHNDDLAALLAEIPFVLQVDLFASEYNHRLPIFFSERPGFTTSGVNALAQDWSLFGPALLVPPPGLITASVHHASLCRSRGLLIAPFWRASDYWFSLCSDGRHLNGIFVDGWARPFNLVSAPHLNRTFSGISSFSFLCLIFDGAVTDHHFTSIVTKSRCVFGGCSLCDS